MGADAELLLMLIEYLALTALPGGLGVFVAVRRGVLSQIGRAHV